MRIPIVFGRPLFRSWGWRYDPDPHKSWLNRLWLQLQVTSTYNDRVSIGPYTGFPWSGFVRAYWGTDAENSSLRPVVKVEWSLRSKFVHAYVEARDANAGGHDTWLISAALPPVAVWVQLPWLPAVRTAMHRPTVRFSLSDGLLSWKFWTDAHAGGVNTWRDGVVNVVEAVVGPLFGKCVHMTALVNEQDFVLPLPEGGFAGHAKLVEHVHDRPRWPWPWRRWLSVDLEFFDPVPYRGRDVDELTVPATSIAEALGKVIARCLESRGGRWVTP